VSSPGDQRAGPACSRMRFGTRATDSTFATNGSISGRAAASDLPRSVAYRVTVAATVGGMNPREYWLKIGAPKVRLRKSEMGRKVTNSAIAAAVESKSGKRTTRNLVEAWFKGFREPYISQLVALCSVMGLEVGDVLRQSHSVSEPLFRSAEGRKPLQKQRHRTSR